MVVNFLPLPHGLLLPMLCLNNHLSFLVLPSLDVILQLLLEGIAATLKLVHFVLEMLLFLSRECLLLFKLFLEVEYLPLLLCVH